MASDSEVAARCIDDPAFAREVLNGDEHAEVRAAILADWKNDEVTGFFNPQPDPPGFQADIQLVDFPSFAQRWKTLQHPNLGSLTGKG